MIKSRPVLARQSNCTGNSRLSYFTEKKLKAYALSLLAKTAHLEPASLPSQAVQTAGTGRPKDTTMHHAANHPMRARVDACGSSSFVVSGRHLVGSTLQQVTLASRSKP